MCDLIALSDIVLWWRRMMSAPRPLFSLPLSLSHSLSRSLSLSANASLLQWKTMLASPYHKRALLSGGVPELISSSKELFPVDARQDVGESVAHVELPSGNSPRHGQRRRQIVIVMVIAQVKNPRGS